MKIDIKKLCFNPLNKMRKKIIYSTVILSIILITFLGIIKYFTTYSIDEHKLSNLNYKVWSHAGNINGETIETNSIKSFDIVSKMKVKGLELDVIYDEKIKKFIVSHDFPYKEFNGKILLLDSVFSKYKNTFTYWLDFKNLKDLNKKNTLESRLILDKIILEKTIKKENILVESTNINNLSHYTKTGYYTSWWVLPYKSKYRSIIRDYKYKLYFVLGKYSSLSMPYKYYSRVESSMNNIPINLWTINDETFFKKAMRKKQVKIILTDQKWFD